MRPTLGICFRRGSPFWSWLVPLSPGYLASCDSVGSIFGSCICSPRETKKAVTPQRDVTACSQVDLRSYLVVGRDSISGSPPATVLAKERQRRYRSIVLNIEPKLLKTPSACAERLHRLVYLGVQAIAQSFLLGPLSQLFIGYRCHHCAHLMLWGGAR